MNDGGSNYIHYNDVYIIKLTKDTVVSNYMYTYMYAHMYLIASN